MNNFYRTAICVPKIKITDCRHNAEEIYRQIEAGAGNHAQIIIFPELSITGATCLDLFKQRDLIEDAEKNFNKLRSKLIGTEILYALGLPLRIKNLLFNCVALCRGEKIIGIVPKINLSDTDMRYFHAGRKNSSTSFHDENLADYEIPFGDLDFNVNNKFVIKVNFDTDFSKHASINLNFASRPVQLDNDFEEIIIKAKCIENENACVYVNTGFGESTTDFVYNGNSFVYEREKKLACAQKYETKSQLIFADIDLDQIKYKINLHNNNDKKIFFDTAVKKIPAPNKNLSAQVNINLPPLKNVARTFAKNPFLDTPNKKKLLQEILLAQRNAIANRLEKIRCEKVVIGVSGGVDSTLSLLNCALTFDYMNISRKNISAVTMPGFGTSSNTFNNSKSLLENLQTSWLNISIKESCEKHFADIQHDLQNFNITFENAQARERTQILFDLANDLNAIVIGTGDMSEEALGFATYNGDHISNYNPNANLPKTVVRELITFISEENYFGNEVSQCLKNILATPISPELLPINQNGECVQLTENIVGPYELIDFFIYYLIKFGYSHDKIIFMAENTFDKYTNDDIQKYFHQFYKRFIKQQFKRSCANDSPQIFSFGFSPRNSFLMPSDV